MQFNELLPILCGLFAGLLLYLIPASKRMIAGVPLILFLGVFATVANGEFSVSWAFLLIDIPLVAGSALVGFGTAYYLRQILRSPA